MISDTLSDAAAEIRRYLAEQPEVYAHVRPKIDVALAVLDAIRMELDTPPESHSTRAEVSAWAAVYALYEAARATMPDR